MFRRNLVVAFALMSFAPGCNGASSVDLPDPDLSSEVLIGGDVEAEIVFDDVLAPDAAGDALPDTHLDLDEGDMVPACAPGDGCFGDPCADNKDCLSGWCVDHLGGMVCTDTCQEDCPAGWSCKQAGTDPDVVWVCVSDFPTLCAPCATGADCTSSVVGTQAPCVEYGAEGSFCGGGCVEDGDCPDGYVCQGMTVASGGTLLQCVSETGICECTDKSIALALSTPCSTESEFGTCEGFRVCTEDGLSACDAGEPIAEFCNGLDDDCDGQVDEDTCDDGNACTDDVCNGADGCEHIALDDIECPDGDLCTVGDQCEQGICVGTPVDCDDGNVCSDDTCDPDTGDCVYTYNALDCDDDDPCTVADECQMGVCVGVSIDCDCVVDDDCGKLEDGDVCNGTLYCDTTMSPHLCKVDLDTLVECPDPEGADAPCLEAACDPGTGACGFAEDNEGFPCDDEDLCTVADTCEKGECLGGAAANCNDGNVCTDDSCEPATGCVLTHNTVPCEDGDVCTVGDQCEDGECVHGPDLSCDDGNVCTDDACDSAVGCVYTPNDGFCDDQNLCTEAGVCAAGACTPGKPLDCNDENVCTDDSCAPALGCVFTPNTLPCNDADVCTISDICAGGACVGGALLPCDDGNLCTDDSCDPLIGCQYVPNSAPCDDQNTCTTSDICVDGECVGEGSLDCDDANPCTKDICLPGGCGHEDIEGPCSDDDPCTLNDACQDGTCVSGAPLDCDDYNPCTDDVCDSDGTCQNVANQATCTDGNACTDGDHCEDGVCVFTVNVDCDDGNVCTTDFCTPTGGCGHTNNTLPCTDGNACTLGDTCAGGSCVGDLVIDCDDGNPCTDDSCDPQLGCVNAANTAPCNDNNACTFGDVCAAGFCQPGIALNCDDGNTCTTDSCNPATGCANTNNVLPCSDGNACTGNDTCSAGTCQPGAAINCGDDGNVCTTDSCDPATGCVYTANTNPCSDGNLCTENDQCSGGACQPGAAKTCDDSNICTTDTCAPLTGCVFTNNTNPCTDTNLCTTVDTCSGGACVGSGTLTCNDGNVCTTDTCAPATGCVFTNNTVSCDDGNACSTTDQCSGGACLGSGTLNCNDGDPCTNDSCNPASGCVQATIYPCCGNDVVESGEQCDDGNQTPGDGCNASCQLEEGVCSAYPDIAAGAMAACLKVFPNCQDSGYAGVVGWADGHYMGGNCSPPNLWQMFCYATAYDDWNCAECYLGHIQRSHTPCGCNPGTTPTIGYWCQ